MKFAFNYAHAFFLSACSLCIVLVLVVLSVHAWGWSSSDIASWVQAIGSIGAIIGAFIVGSRQSKSDRQQAIESEARMRTQKIEAIQAVVDHAMGQARSAAESFQRMPTQILKMVLDQPIYSLSEAADALLNIPLHEVGPSEAVTQFASLQVVLKDMSATVAAFKMMAITAASLAHIEYRDRLTGAAAVAQFHAERFAIAVAGQPNSPDASAPR